MSEIKRAQIFYEEPAEARNGLLITQKKINETSDAIAEEDDRSREDGQRLEDHKESFFWFESKKAGSTTFYWVIALYFCLLCIVDVVFIGFASTESILKAVVLPVSFLIGETLLLCKIVLMAIELSGNEWPVDMKRIDKDDLGPGSAYRNLNLAKNAVVVLFGLWAFFLMVDSHRYEMMLERMMADDAVIYGDQSDYYSVGFWEAATNSILPWLYGCVALFLHWVYTRFPKKVYLAVSYFFGFRTKYKALTKSIRAAKTERRKLLTGLAVLYGKHLSDLKEATSRFESFRVPEDIINTAAYAYISEALGRPIEFQAQRDSYASNDEGVHVNGKAHTSA